MICPHCTHKIPLTWPNYFKSLWGVHTCPGCLKRFKVIVTAASFLLVLAFSVVAAATPAVIVFFFIENFWYTIGAYLLLLLVVVLPFDRWLDNHVRPTKPID